MICGAGISGARHSAFVFNSPWWILLPGIYLANSKSLCTHSFLWQAVSQLNNTYCLVLPIFSYPEAGWVFSAGCHSSPAPDPAHTGEVEGWVNGIWNNVAVVIRCAIISRPQAGCVLGAKTQLLTCLVANRSHGAVCVMDKGRFWEWTGEDGHSLGREWRAAWNQISRRWWDWRQHPLPGMWKLCSNSFMPSSGKEKGAAGCDLHAETWKQDLKVGILQGERTQHPLFQHMRRLISLQRSVRPTWQIKFSLSSEQRSFQAKAHQVAGPWQGRRAVFKFDHSRNSTYQSHLHHFYPYQE